MQGGGHGRSVDVRGRSCAHHAHVKCAELERWRTRVRDAHANACTHRHAIDVSACVCGQGRSLRGLPRRADWGSAGGTPWRALPPVAYAHSSTSAHLQPPPQRAVERGRYRRPIRRLHAHAHVLRRRIRPPLITRQRALLSSAAHLCVSVCVCACVRLLFLLFGGEVK